MSENTVQPEHQNRLPLWITAEDADAIVTVLEMQRANIAHFIAQEVKAKLAWQSEETIGVVWSSIHSSVERVRKIESLSERCKVLSQTLRMPPAKPHA